MDGGVGLYILIEFSAVDVDVDDFGIRGISFDNTGNTVVETESDSKDDIGFVGIDVRGRCFRAFLPFLCKVDGRKEQMKVRAESTLPGYRPFRQVR